MTLSRYLLIMTAATLICWAIWFLLVLNINPFEASVLSFFFFYISFFLALVGSFAIVGFVSRVHLLKQDEPYFRQVAKSFRHGLLISSLLVIALLLQSQQILNWWNILLLILAFSFLELFLISKTA